MVQQSTVGVLEQLRDFLKDIDYELPPWPASTALEEAVASDIESWNLGELAHGIKAAAHVGTVCGEFFYHGLNFKVRKLAAIMTTLAVWLDNLPVENLNGMADFQRRFYLRLPQLHPGLAIYADYLSEFYLYYEDTIADMIIQALVQFITGTVLEERALAGNSMMPSAHAKRWPYFVRNMSGIGIFYALASFTLDTHPNMLAFIQAMPDLAKYINLGNDIMSYYKEALDNEDTNYVTARAQLVGKEPNVVYGDVIADGISARNAVIGTLANNPEALKTFYNFERGYHLFHIFLPRYRLPIDICKRGLPDIHAKGFVNDKGVVNIDPFMNGRNFVGGETPATEDAAAKKVEA